MFTSEQDIMSKNSKVMRLLAMHHPLWLQGGVEGGTALRKIQR